MWAGEMVLSQFAAPVLDAIALFPGSRVRAEKKELSRKNCSVKKKCSGRIKIAGIPIPPEQFFLKRVIRTWKIDPEINMYRETHNLLT